MKIDVSKLLRIDYINDLVLQSKVYIDGVRNCFLQKYSLDSVEQMEKEEISSLFNQYGVNCDNILQYVFSELINDGWEFADLYRDDVIKTNEFSKQLVDNARVEVEQLNDKIEAINNGYQQEIDTMLDDMEIYQVIQSILTEDYVSKELVNKLYELLLTLEVTEEEKFRFSLDVVNYLIENGKCVFVEKTKNVDTSSFELLLDDVYSTVVVEDVNENVIEPSYSETIIGYYQYYKPLFVSVGMNTTLDEIMLDSYELSNGIGSSVDSVSKINFCMELGALLYLLHENQSNNKNNQEFIRDLLMDLSILDRIYEEDSSNKVYKEEMLANIDNDISIITGIGFEGIFSEKLVNRLRLLQSELNDNLISNNRKNEIDCEYKKIKNDLIILDDSNKQLNLLKGLFVKINDILSDGNHKKENSEYYINLTRLYENVTRLIDVVSENGFSSNIDDLISEIEKELIKYTSVNKKEEKVNLNGFVLFDFDENNQGYVVNDLDPNNKNNMIDNVLYDKMAIGFEDYSDLINDLFMYGVPRILMYGQTDNTYKIIDKVFYDKKNRESDNGTGLWRIRPRNSSIVRFIGCQIILQPYTNIYKQIVGLICEMLPNVEIDMEKEFKLYINFGSTMKKGDTSPYDISIKRYERKKPVYKTLLENDKNCELDDSEIALLREFIKISLNACLELEKNNNMLKFDIINQIGGAKYRG